MDVKVRESRATDALTPITPERTMTTESPFGRDYNFPPDLTEECRQCPAKFTTTGKEASIAYRLSVWRNDAVMYLPCPDCGCSIAFTIPIDLLLTLKENPFPGKKPYRESAA